MKPGIYHGLPMREYLALDACSSSRLKWMRRSPAYCDFMATEEHEHTDATRIGDVSHTAIFEAAKLNTRYVIKDKCAATTSSGGLCKNTGSVLHEGKWYCGVRGHAPEGAAMPEDVTCIKQHELDTAIRIAHHVHSHPQATGAIDKATDVEVTWVWEECGHLCKARPDFVGPGYIGDLKTTSNLLGFSPWEITKFRYYGQAAWYLRGAAELGIDVRHYFYVVVASDLPHEVAVFDLDELAIKAGKEENDRLFGDWRACVEAGEWPGNQPGIQTAEISDKRFSEIFPEENAR